MPDPILSRFARVLLEAEVSKSAWADFIKKYGLLTGEDATNLQYCQLQPNKWGLEARLYFDGDETLISNLAKLGYHVELRESAGYRDDYSYRVNSQSLFWRAVEHGYRLGPNIQIL